MREGKCFVFMSMMTTDETDESMAMARVTATAGAANIKMML